MGIRDYLHLVEHERSGQTELMQQRYLQDLAARRAGYPKRKPVSPAEFLRMHAHELDQPDDNTSDERRQKVQREINRDGWGDFTS